MTRPLVVLPLLGVGEVAPEGLAALAARLERACTAHDGLRPGDVVAVSSKVASKALGLRLPAARREHAVELGTVRVVAERSVGEGRVTRVVEALAGPVMAAAGVDASNVGGDDDVLLLPEDPDAVADELRTALAEAAGLAPDELAVVLTDTAGRPWRAGQTDLALGASGLQVLLDHRGELDGDARPLAVTSRAVADEVAAAADLVKGKADRVPAAILRGLDHLLHRDGRGARTLVRTGAGDWFALGHAEAVRAALGVRPGSALAAAVGIRTSAPEPADVRVARAVRTALLPLPEETAEEVGVDLGPAELVLAGSDPFVLGLVRGRLGVALHGEGVEITAEAWTADGLRLTLGDLPG